MTYSTLEEIRCNTTAFDNATDSAVTVTVDHGAEAGDDGWMSLLTVGGSIGLDKVLGVDGRQVTPLKPGARPAFSRPLHTLHPIPCMLVRFVKLLASPT